MSTIYKLSFLILAFLFIQPVEAQTWETFFEKTEKKWEKGAYSKIYKDLKKLRKKHIAKKWGDDPTMYVFADIMEAKVANGLKDYAKMNDVIKQAAIGLSEIKSNDPVGYQIGMLRLIDLYTDYGNHLIADSLVKELKRDMYYAIDELLPNEILIREAITLKNNGLYVESDSVLSIVKNTWSTLYTKAYEMEVTDKVDIAYRNDLMAKLMMLEVELLSLEGDYQAAIDLQSEKENRRVFERLEKKGATITQNQQLEIDLYFNYGDIDQALKLNRRLISSNPLGVGKETALFRQLDLIYASRDEVKKIDVENIEKALLAHYSKSNFNSDYHKYVMRYFESYQNMMREEIPKALSTLNYLYSFNPVFIPFDHPFREMTARTAIKFALNGAPEDQLSAERFFTGLNENIELRYLNNSLVHDLFEVELAGYYMNHSEKPGEAFEILSREPYKHIQNELSFRHQIWPEIYTHLEEYFSYTADYQSGIDIVNNIIKAMEENPNTDKVDLGAQYVNLAKMQVGDGQYQKAETNVDDALTMIFWSGERVSEENVKALNTAAFIYGTIGVYDKAERQMNRAERIAKKIDNDQLLMASVEDLASMLIRVGNYSKTEDLLNILVDKKLELYGPESRRLIKPMRALGELYMIKGDFGNSEKNLIQALDNTANLFGDTTLMYSQTLAILVDLYQGLGNYEGALEQIERVIAIRESLLRADHILLARPYSQLGLIHFHLGADFETVDHYFQKSKNIVAANFDQTHPLYAEAIKNIAFHDVQHGKLDNALKLLNQADEIWASALGNKNKSSGEVARLKGDIYSYRQDFGSALDEYNRSSKFFKDIFSDQHPEYLNTQSKLARSYFINNELNKVDNVLEETTESYLNYTKLYFPTLSEEGKSKFWTKIKPDFEFFNTYAITYYEDKPKYVEDMFDFALATKGLLLNSSIKTRQSILNSGDMEVINLFESWTEKKEFLATCLARTPQQLEEDEIDIKALESEITDLEKELSEKSEAFADDQKSKDVDWKEVRKVLADNEAAVEIVRFREFDTDFNENKVRYAALVVTNETSRRPLLVYLPNGNEMEGKYFKAQRASFKYNIKDRTSYDTFWKPIHEAIGDKSVVYFSPDGVYNQLNVESFLMPSGEYVIDQQNVRVINSTKALVMSRSRAAKRQERRDSRRVRSAVLFGNPDYYRRKEEQIFVADTATRAISLDFVPQLPGTEKEVKVVEDLLAKNQWKTNSYMGMDATEKVLKDLDSVDLIHIATHGFFDDDPTPVNSPFNLLNQDNPLNRSGLLAMGGGDLLKKSHGNYNLEDGILTAYEAMSLNFENTELVILSACETARGEIRQGEGVFGLQRSFLIAGADAIVMSLFTVSDEVTQKLMVEFYDKWLSGMDDGIDKRVAFNLAQKAIKEEHPEPKFWGAFIMVSNK
ncbi:MAG: CHAT domain-containing protein [Cyclobacteriaceae bacterium]